MARSKEAATVALAAVIVLGLAGALFVYNSRTPQDIPAGCQDPDSISSHVYNPSRLIVQKPCVTVTGTVERVISEDDGDYHLRLRLDPEYANLTNDANVTYQYGDLVVEVICARPVTQQDAITACENYQNQITIPKEGQHIMASGPYVLDSGHHGWAEIHPVYSLTVF